MLGLNVARLSAWVWGRLDAHQATALGYFLLGVVALAHIPPDAVLGVHEVFSFRLPC